MSHDVIEKNIGLMALLVLLVISIGGLVEIVPLFFLKSTTEPVEGLKPYTAATRRARCLHPRRLLCVPFADDPAFPSRDRTLRSLLGSG